MTAERGLPPGRGGEGRRPGSPGPRRVEPPPGGPLRPDPAAPSGDRLRPAVPSGEPQGAAASLRPGRPAAGAARASGRSALVTPPPASRGPRRLAPPRAIKVRADPAGRPQAIAGRAVEAVRESWLVEDRWWTDAPLRRRYWEVVTADGRDLVVFRDLQGGRWFAQR
jgi:hypothetical protein